MAKKIENKRAAQDIDKFIGGRIRVERITANMSQDTLGQTLGISFQQIQKYEKGVNRVPYARLRQIAELFGKPLAWFSDEPATATGKAQDTIMTKMLSTSRGRELATLYLDAPDPVQALALNLLRTTTQMAA